jgi:uncharacterized protein YggT (Ycf19 family)
MSGIDLILNLTALLLWVSWRSVRLSQITKPALLSLAGTVRPASPRRFKGWELLLVLAALLLLRAWIYYQVGAAVDWVPKLDLGMVVLPFRSDRFWLVLLFSVLSFTRDWFLFYFSLVVLALLNRRASDVDPVQKLIRLHLGRLARWPGPVQIALLPVLIVLLWTALAPVLNHLEITSRARAEVILVEQGAMVSLALFFSLKYLLPALLLVYFLTSYVYLGSNPVWDFIAACARTLLAPLRPLPLHVGRLDLAPLTGVVVVLVLLQVAPTLVLRRLDQLHLTLWPH